MPHEARSPTPDSWASGLACKRRDNPFERTAEVGSARVHSGRCGVGGVGLAAAGGGLVHLAGDQLGVAARLRGSPF